MVSSSRIAPLRRLAFALAVLVALVTSAACGGKTPTPPPAGPFIQCPADLQVDSQDGAAVPVTYSMPAATGGTPPYAVACNPPSGTTIGVGTSSVTCTATDSRGQSTICSFTVTVVRPPRLTLSRFLAFGDSLTEGYIFETPTSTLIDVPNSYPSRLDKLLRAYFRGQSLIVMNDGVGGELITQGSLHSPRGGRVRLPLSIEANRPEVVLIMEGTNDLMLDAAVAEDVQTAAVDDLRRMVEDAQMRGQRVFLATIPPMSASGTKNINPEVVAAVPEFNNRVRTVAFTRGAALVDVYEALRDRPEMLGPDGLHLTSQGYQRVAELFFDAIKRELEARP